jgi:hypothetical protein
MDTYKLKIRVGDHEFEAEGPVEVVQAQFAEFRDLLNSIPTKPKEPEPPAAPLSDDPVVDNITKLPALPHLPLEKILKVEGRKVSLTAQCETVDEAVLLILLGQMEFRANQEVTGAEIMDGLKQSGWVLDRVDKTLDKLSREGNVHTMGVHRGRRYRLTNLGKRTALGVADELLKTVP